MWQGARGTPVCAHLCRVCSPEAAGLSTHTGGWTLFFREMLVLKQKKELPLEIAKLGADSLNRLSRGFGIGLL